MDNMGTNNTDKSFQNSFPIDDTHKIDNNRRLKRGKNLSALNIGQILLLIILFTIICLQTINLFLNPVQNITALPLNIQSDTVYRQPEVPEFPGSYYSGGQAGGADFADMDMTVELEAPGLGTGVGGEVIFILGQSGGRLAILSPDGQTVYETFNVYINTLPEIDRALLLEGIKITTTEELGSLLEDFGS